MAIALDPEQVAIVSAAYERSCIFLDAVLDVPPPRINVARYVLWRTAYGEIDARVLFEATIKKFHRPPMVMTARTLQRRYCG